MSFLCGLDPFSCTSTCCSISAANSVSQLFTPKINGATGTLEFNPSKAGELVNCAFNKFTSIAGEHPLVEIQSQVNKILTTTGNTTTQIFYIIFGGLSLTLLLLTIIIFAAIYWRQAPYVIPLLFVLALIIIIAAGVVIFFWASSVYESGSSAVNANIDIIETIISHIQTAALASVCCFGQKECPSYGGSCCCCDKPACSNKSPCLLNSSTF